MLVTVLERSRQLGFLGPGDPLFHVEHAEGFAELVAGADRILDLGSGGGVPGLVVAVRQPSTQHVLLDAMRKRCAFIEEAVEDLGVAERVEVVCGRAEDVVTQPGRRSSVDVVTSRSFGSPSATAECAAPYLAVGGMLVVSEPPDEAASDPRWDATALQVLGLRDEGRTERRGFGFRVLRQVSPCPDRFPRRVGVAAKRPLF